MSEMLNILLRARFNKLSRIFSAYFFGFGTSKRYNNAAGIQWTNLSSAVTVLELTDVLLLTVH